MRLDLRSIIHVPGASLPFQFELDLSGLDFYGEKPFAHPVRVSGAVRNMADALLLEGEAETDESLLTGEAVPMQKMPGDHLLSGSVVVSGACAARVERVGADNDVTRLTRAARSC